MTKLLVADVHPAEVFLIRNLAAFALCVGVLRIQGLQTPRAVGPFWLLIRSSLAAASLVCLFGAFRTLDMATAMAIHLSAIPSTALVSALLDRGVRMSPTLGWMGALGFAGVLLVLQPQALVPSIGLTLAVASAVLSGASLFLLGRVSRHDTAVAITFYLCLVGIVVTAPFVAFVWSTPSLTTIALAAGIGVLSGGAQLLFTKALALSSNAFVAPFQYTGVLFAGIFDAIVWGRTPNGVGLVGFGLIIAGTVVAYVVGARIWLRRSPPSPAA